MSVIENFVQQFRWPQLDQLMLVFLPLMLVSGAPITRGQVAAPSSPKISPVFPKSPEPNPLAIPRSACDQQRALQLIEQQAAEAKVLDKPIQRISIMARAADLLWPLAQDKARALFSDAYEQASAYYLQQGDEVKKGGRGMIIRMEDPRSIVVQSVARHDSAWAKRLAERTVEETKQRAQQEAATTVNRSEAGDKLLSMATSILKTDQNLALTLARSSLQYPASYDLPWFLNQLAEVNQAAADRLYREALNAYAHARINETLLLSAYPFAQHRVVGEEASFYYFNPPPSFNLPSDEQRLFLDVLLERARKFVEAPALAVDGEQHRLPESAQLYLALQGLEPLVARYQPGYIDRVSEAKALVGSLLTPDLQGQTAKTWQQQQELDRDSSESLPDRIEKETDPERRNQYIAQAVMAAEGRQSFDRIAGLIDKVSDAALQQQLLEFLYFKRARKATKEGRLEEASQLAGKVQELDFRSYLAFEIAAERIKKEDDKLRVREVLDDVATAAQKAPNTMAKARALLGVVYLYAKFDQQRALEVMSDAVRTINKIDEPDLTSGAILRRIEGKNFGMYTAYQVPGFSLENSFLGLEGYDFDGTLYLARNLTDALVRATGVLALASKCLERVEQQKKQPKRRKAAKP